MLDNLKDEFNGFSHFNPTYAIEVLGADDYDLITPDPTIQSGLESLYPRLSIKSQDSGVAVSEDHSKSIPSVKFTQEDATTP